jgi:hypothetical protein
VAAGPDLAGIVQQALADILPDGFRPIQPDRVSLLYLDDALAAAARHPEHMAFDLG